MSKTAEGHTIRLHRVLRAPPERIYRAFLDADALAKWLPPNGFTCKVHHLEPKVGGSYRMSFTNFATGHGHSFGGEFLELVPSERIRHTDKFEDPNLTGVVARVLGRERLRALTVACVLQQRAYRVAHLFGGRFRRLQVDACARACNAHGNLRLVFGPACH